MATKKNLKNTREVTEKKDSKTSNLNTIKQGTNSDLLYDLILDGNKQTREKFSNLIKEERKKRMKKAAKMKDPLKTKYIKNMSKIMDDLDTRIKGKKTDNNRQNLLDLNEKKGFNTKVLKSFADEILEEAKTENPAWKQGIIKKLTQNADHRQDIERFLTHRMLDKNDKDYEIQKKNIDKFIKTVSKGKETTNKVVGKVYYDNVIENIEKKYEAMETKGDLLKKEMKNFDKDNSIEEGKTFDAKFTYIQKSQFDRFDKELDDIIADIDTKIEIAKEQGEAETIEKLGNIKKKYEVIKKNITKKNKKFREKKYPKYGKKETSNETAKESTLTLVKTRLQETINRYIEKIKKIKNADKGQKEQLTKEIETMKEDLRKVKEEYENAENNLFGKIEYKPEQLTRMSTRRISWAKKQEKNGVIIGGHMERLRMTNIKRRMTINRLIKKFDKIGDNTENATRDGVRFIMGFSKKRFLRYSKARIYTEIDETGSDLGLQMSPEKFHRRFNAGRDNIFAVLNKGTPSEDEQKIIDKLKDRINYYGHAYAKQRATARTKPFVAAQKKTESEEKKIEDYTDKELKAELEKRNKKTK